MSFSIFIFVSMVTATCHLLNLCVFRVFYARLLGYCFQWTSVCNVGNWSTPHCCELSFLVCFLSIFVFCVAELKLMFN